MGPDCECTAIGNQGSTSGIGSIKMIYPFIIIAVIFWASIFVGIRAALSEYTPIDIAVLRFVISSVALVFMAVPGRLRWPEKQDWQLFGLLGLVLFINMISLNSGMRTITAGETTFILSSSQLFQVLLAWGFLHEKISRQFLLGLLFCFSGITVIAFQQTLGTSFNWGIGFVLMAAITNAVFFVLQKPALQRYSPQEVISYTLWIATLLMLPFGGNVAGVIRSASTGATATIVYIGIAALAANLCWSKALSRMDASRAAVFLYTIPVVTIIAGFFWLDELPSLGALMGGAIILGGVFISNAALPGDGHGSRGDHRQGIDGKLN